jgi:ketopantoate reductase
VIRKPIGAIGGDPDTRKLFGDALVETVAVARAKGIELGADYLAQQVNFVDRVPPETKSSMQMDLEAGRRLRTRLVVGRGRAHWR